MARGIQINLDPGTRFGQWTVICRTSPHIGPTGHHHGRWLCRCDCGAEKAVITNHLLSGRSTRCVKCQSRGRRQISDEKVSEAVRRFKANESLTAIAASLGVSRSSLTSHVSKRIDITLGFWTKPIGRRAEAKALAKGFDVAYRTYRRHFASARGMELQYHRYRALVEVQRLETIISDPVFRTHAMTRCGMAARDIAAELNVAERTVVRYRRLTPSETPKLDTGRIATMRGRGVDWAAINKKLGRPCESGYMLDAVYNWLLDNQERLMPAQAEVAA